MFVRTKHSVLMWVGLNIWDTSSNHLNENMGCVILKQTYGILWVLFYVTCELNISTRTFYHLSWSCWSPLFQCQWQPQCRSLKQVWTLPAGNLTLLLKIAIYSGFTHWKWWFSIVMLVYQRVSASTMGGEQNWVFFLGVSADLTNEPWDFLTSNLEILDALYMVF